MCKFSPFKTEKCHREINKDLKKWEISYAYGLRSKILWKHQFTLNWYKDINQSQSKI